MTVFEFLDKLLNNLNLQLKKENVKFIAANKIPPLKETNNEFYLGKAVYTTKIAKKEAQEWFEYFKQYTNFFIKENFKWYVINGYWPLQAQKENGGDKKPIFAVIHHTSNKKGNYKPALYRFFQASKASSNFLLGRENNESLYLVDIKNMAYHAVQRTWLPLNVRRALNLDGGWISNCGTEVAGNGNSLLFSYSQLLRTIVIHRYLAALKPSLKKLKSHRFFSKISRANDPGFLFFLPLVEHACFTNVDLTDKKYWLEKYKNNPVDFANEAAQWMKKYDVYKYDEWKSKRKNKVTNKFLLHSKS